MKNVFSRVLDRGPVSVTLAVVLSVLFVTGLVNAATTISTNISTAGTLTVDTTSTLTGAVTMGSTLAVTGAVNASSTLATSGNITVPAGYALDTAGAGILNLGTTTATTINIGRSGQTVALAGNVTVVGTLNASSTLATSGKITVPAGYTLDTAGAGALNLGTTTATSVIIGSATAKVGIASTSPYVALGVTGTTTASAGMVVGALGSPITQLLFGTCTYNPAAAITASSSLSTNCTGATGVNTGDKVFVTPRSLTNSLVLTSASSTSSGVIQVTVYYIATSTAGGNYTPASATWDWMAIH